MQQKWETISWLHHFYSQWL